jgi:hypothetical protein
MVAGTELLELARRRILALDAAGLRPGDVFATTDQGPGRVIDALACLLGGFVYWPVPGASPLLDGPATTERDAPLLWRPNPVGPDCLSPVGPHDPPVALPHRLPAAVHDLLLAAGPHARLLLDGVVPGLPFPMTLQSLARLGATLRRRLRIKSQGVRYCAAPGSSAIGALLDLLPGLVGRQVIVIPADGTPSPTSIVRAIARYRPDHLTLTARQAAALLDMPMDQETRQALTSARLVVADVNPIVHALRSALSDACQRLDVAYVLPEVGDIAMLSRPR